MVSNTSLSATVVALPSAGVAIPARLTIARHSCSNQRSIESVGKVKNADKAKKCNTTCDLIPHSCDESDENRNVRNEHKTPQKDSYQFDIQVTLPWPIHYLKADTLHTTKDTFVSVCPGKIIQSRKNSSNAGIPLLFPCEFSHPDSLKTQNPASTRNRNSRIPHLFSAPIPNIATKISQIPHPAKPIVDPHFCQTCLLTRWVVFSICTSSRTSEDAKSVFLCNMLWVGENRKIERGRLQLNLASLSIHGSVKCPVKSFQTLTMTVQSATVAQLRPRLRIYLS